MSSIVDFIGLDKAVKKPDKKGYIFDSMRKKYVCHQPEEVVRQQVVRYLVEELAYPRALITLEECIVYGGLKKRVDIMIRARKTASPLMLIECKAWHYGIKQEHLNQLTMYNSVMQAPFIVLTNGVHQLLSLIHI